MPPTSKWLSVKKFAPDRWRFSEAGDFIFVQTKKSRGLREKFHGMSLCFNLLHAFPIHKCVEVQNRGIGVDLAGHVPVIARRACFSDIGTESTESLVLLHSPARSPFPIFCAAQQFQKQLAVCYQPLRSCLVARCPTTLWPRHVTAACLAI